MKWFDRWFYKKSEEAWQAAHQPKDAGIPAPSNNTFYNVNSGLSFSVYSADGGIIINATRSSTSYPNESHLYVITQTEDLPNKLSEIITMELLKNQ